jgi:radical SAM superfamily enzyme YgiQ (UPF0313 family)
MDICLITAPTATEFEFATEITSESVRRAACQPQLGILSLAAVLEQSGYNLRIVDLNRAYLNYAMSAGVKNAEDFLQIATQLIVETGAEIYGFSSICSSYPLTIRIAEAVKAQRKSASILLGGPQVSVVDIQTLTAFPFIDLVLRGEAEHSLPLLIEELEGQRRLEQVFGLSYRSTTGVRRNPRSPVIQDLDSLPSPAYHLTCDLQGSGCAALEIGRGCPFACTFCSTNDFFRRTFRLRSPERVLRDMRTIAAEYSIRDFELVHDMFTVDRQRVVAFCTTMISSHEGFTWSCSARTDCIDEELLELMAQAGCRGIFLGVESGSARMQKLIDKHLDPQRADEILDAAETLGINTTVSLIAGFPEETWEDLSQTIRMFMHSARCPRSSPQLNLLAPLADTPIYTANKDKIVLEELCSEMSQQSSSQREADLSLIRANPEIFPNFYIFPTPNLDRACLLELREFASLGVGHLRWLISAIDQETEGILDFFLEWRQHRLQSHPQLKGFELRRYYRAAFCADFLSFVQTHPISKRPIVEVLLQYEQAALNAFSRNVELERVGAPVLLEDALRWNDTVVCSASTPLIEVSLNIQLVIDVIKSRSRPTWNYGRHSYVMRRTSAACSRLERVSNWVASLLRACREPLSVETVFRQLSVDIPEVEEPVRTYAFVRLLKAAQEKGFIEIYRTCVDAFEDHQPGPSDRHNTAMTV